MLEKGVEELWLLLCEVPPAGAAPEPHSWVMGQAKPAAHLLPPAPNLQPLPAAPEITRGIFHKAFNCFLRGWTLGLGLEWSACQAGFQCALSLEDSQKSAPFSPPLTCGSLKTETQIETMSSSSPCPRPRIPGFGRGKAIIAHVGSNLPAMLCGL